MRKIMGKDNFIKFPNDIGIIYRQDLPFLIEDIEWIYDKNSFTLEDLVDKNPNQAYIEDNEVYVSKELIEKLSQDKDYIFVKFDYLNNNHKYFNDFNLNEELKITDEYLVKLTKSLIEEEFDRLADISEDLIVYLLEHNPNIKDSLDFLLTSNIQLENHTETWIELIRPTLANKLKITETEIDISYFNEYFGPEIDFRNNLYEPYKEMSEETIESILLKEYSEQEYLIEVKMKDGGYGVIDLDFNEQGDIAYIDMSEEPSSKLLTDFYEKIHTMCGIIDYVEDLVNKKKEKQFDENDLDDIGR